MITFFLFVPAEEDESKSPRARTQTPVYSAAPRNNNDVELSSRNDRISMATPSTADLYSVMNLRTKTEHLAEEYVKLINIQPIDLYVILNCRHVTRLTL